MNGRSGISPWDPARQVLGPKRGTFSDQQPRRRQSKKRPLPRQDSLPHGPTQQNMGPRQNVTGEYSERRSDQLQNPSYILPAQVIPQPHIPFAHPPFQQPQIPLTNATFGQSQEHPLSTSEYQDPFEGSFVTSGPVVHEGFVPAPGHEKDDEFDYPAYRDSFFQVQSDDGADSDDEEALLADEGRILREIENRQDDVERDSDYSAAASEELEDDADEMILDDDFDEDEEDRPQRRSSKRGGRSRGRGRRGRGGGPASRGRGDSAGTPSRRGRKKGTPGRPKGKRGPRPAADPGPQFKEYQRLANAAYLNKDYDTAIENASKAIQTNPEIFAAHSLLSEIFADIGDEQKSLEAIIIGAPTKRDKELWYLIIDRIQAINEEEYPLFTEENKCSIIIDCLRAVISIDPNDYSARSQRLVLEAKLGHASKAVKMARKMLTIRPFDDGVLKIMARMGTSSTKQTKIHLSRIIASFDTSIAYFLAHDQPSDSAFNWSILNIYLDLLDRSGDYDRGLPRLKALSRWLQNRKTETFWDEQEDDREFDLEDDPRRTEVPQFERNKTSYGQMLPLEIRTKMGLFRLRKDPPDFSEAMHHFNILERDNDGPEPTVQDYPDLFSEVADALHAAEHNESALRFYEPLYSISFKWMTLRNFIGMYSSYKALGQVGKADALLPIFRKWNPDTLQDMAVLAKFFEDNNMNDEAMKRAEAVYKFGGYRLLLKIGFKGYDEIKDYFFNERKRARGKHSVRKNRVKRYMKALRSATRDEYESGSEGSGEMPSLGPMTDRPEDGLFRTRKSLVGRRPKTFLPDELPGTNVPIDAIDQTLFRRRLNELASEYPDELKSARAQHREVVASFEKLEELSVAAENGDQPSTIEYLSIARELIEEFSTFDLFYYDRRHPFKGYFRRVAAGEIWNESALMVLAVIANNVEDGEEEPEIKEKPDKVPEDFYGIHFDKWFDTFAQYAILLARQGDEERCFNTLEVASQSNIFHNSQRYMHSLQLCRLACALVLDDSIEGSSAVRWFLRTYPFSGDLFRLYSSVNRFTSVPNGFATGPALKVVVRWIKTMDYALLTSEQRADFNFRGNDAANWMAKEVSSQIIKHVKAHDPALFALYGHLLMCGGSYVAALNHYFRAFTITPEDPVLNLSIGVAYIQHAMKRLSENRQFQIQQGLSFMYRYYDLRTKDDIPVYCSEAEFNLGRVWHTLGLVTQAIPAYERCISLSQRVQAEWRRNGVRSGGRPDQRVGEIEMKAAEDFATEAAFAIQTIYTLSGNFEGSRRVTEEALVIE